MGFHRNVLLCLVAGLTLACSHNTKPAVQVHLVAPSSDSAQNLLAILQFDAITAVFVDRQKAIFCAQLEEASVQAGFNSEQRALLQEYKEKALLALDDALSWSRVEAILVAAFQESYSPQNIDALITFYHSDAGRAVVAKVPLATQVFTRERLDEWESIRITQGQKAAEDRIKEEIGVVFKPSEVDGFCAFYASPMGKEIMARSSHMKGLLNDRVIGQVNELDVRMRALAADYNSRIMAAASAK